MVSISNIISPLLRAVECGAPGEIFHNIDCKGYVERYHAHYSHTVKLSRTEHYYCNYSPFRAANDWYIQVVEYQVEIMPGSYN